jgi:hypothetical protein
MGYTEVRKQGTQGWDSYSGQVALWIKAGGDPKKFLNGVSVYSKQWKGASTADNLKVVRRRAGNGERRRPLGALPKGSPGNARSRMELVQQLEVDRQDQGFDHPVICRHKLVANVLKRSHRMSISL